MDDIEKLKRTLGQTLRGVRRDAGLTEQEMATWLGLVPDVYGRIERGEMLPSVPTLYRLCLTFHLSAGAVLGQTPEETAPPELPPPEPPSPEVLQLTRLLRELSPGDLRSLEAIASVLARESAAGEPPGE